MNSQAEIYRYQDDSGNWHFTDKKPKQPSDTVNQNLNRKSNKTNSAIRPYLESSPVHEGYILKIVNPLPAPVHCLALDKDQSPLIAIVEAYASSPMMTPSRDRYLSFSPLKPKAYSLDCIIGRPDTEPTAYIYAAPFSNYKPMEVTQGFKGRFSHSKPPHLHAIDIAMPIGTEITASRPGVVIGMKDDYAYAGTNSAFFYDKANYVRVYHDDGTYATYAHMLMGKVMVEIGDTVEKGQPLGLSGNSGFSTGPHLHFIIHYNHKGQVTSLPFVINQNEEALEPKKGMWLIKNENN
jgi:murein DD-endopeptidase MepM/ murein hydrolase activator NlpD